jgi:hypothetical protein
MYAKFCIGASICSPDFANQVCIKLSSKFDATILPINIGSLVEKALKKKTYYDWYTMGDIPGFDPFPGISEDSFDLNDPFTRYERIWKNPNKLRYIINQDIGEYLIPFFESVYNEQKVLSYIKENNELGHVGYIGNLFVAVKEIEEGDYDMGISI